MVFSDFYATDVTIIGIIFAYDLEKVGGNDLVHLEVSEKP